MRKGFMTGRRYASLAAFPPLLLLSLSAVSSDPVVFRHALDNSPLEVKPRPNEVETEAVKEFKATGNNAYSANEAALAEGKKLYLPNCRHLGTATLLLCLHKKRISSTLSG